MSKPAQLGITIRVPGLKERIEALIPKRDDDAMKSFMEKTLAYLGEPDALITTKRDIIRAHPELSAREIRRRYGISVNHVRVERANNFTKRKSTGKLK